MSLLPYLFQHFYTEDQLIEEAQITGEKLQQFQSKGMMPLPAYKLACDVNCQSFFGAYQEQQLIHFYAKGMTEWLSQVTKMQVAEQAYELFKSDYLNELSKLKQILPIDQYAAINNTDKLIETEWQHYLSGTYGLCTRSGLAPDIATKEACIGLIKVLMNQPKHDFNELKVLKEAVTLLDQASSLFAPHERQRSSRQTYIDDIRYTCDLVL